MLGHRAAVALIALVAGAGALADQPLVRWGVVPDPQLSPQADLVGVALGEIAGVKLVEREQLGKVLSELTMSALLGPDAAAKRLQMGALLSADALLFLAVDKQRDRQSVQLLVSDCRYGARLAQEYFPGDVDGQTLARRARQIAEDLRRQYASGVTSMVAVPAFRCGDLGYEHRHLQDGLANVLRSALLTAPGMAVLELDEVRAIQQELGLAGAPGVARSAIPIFVEGDYRIETKGETPVVKLKIASTAAGRRQENQREFPSVDAAAASLREVVAAEIIQQARAGGAPLPLERQVALLSQRADQFTSVGSVFRATGLREAILLLDPSNVEQTMRLVREYAEVVPFKSQMDWSRVPRDEALRSISDRFGVWRRALDLVARLISRRLATQVDTLLLLRTLDEAMSDFQMRNALSVHDLSADTALVDELVRQLADASRAEREFVHGAALNIPGLEPGDASRLRWRPPDLPNAIPEPRSNPKAAARELRDAWIQYVTAHFGRTRAGPAPLTDRLDHFAWCLEQPLAEERRIHGFFSEFATMCADGDTREAHGVSIDALDAWVHRLERSPSIAAQAHGRLGRIAFDHFIGRDGAHSSVEQALKQLDDWKSYAQPLGFRNDHPVEALRRCLALPVPATEPPASPPQSAPALQTPTWLALEEVRIHVKRIGGKRLSLADWLVLPFGPDAILDDHVLACGSFDAFWNGWSIRVQRVPGEMQELWFRVRHGHAGIHDVAFDGRHIWAITCCEGVMVLDQTGREVARLAVGDQLPAAHAGARLACIEPGRMLAVGSFGADKRAWCATLTLGDQAITCDVFHEATTVFTDPKSLSTSFSDPNTVFVPVGVYRLDGAGNPPRFLVQRAIANERRAGPVFEPGFLELDVAGRRASVLDYMLDRNRIGNHPPRLAFVGADCLRINGSMVERCPPPGRNAVPLTLFRGGDETIEPDLYPLDDAFVFHGAKRWYRLDPRSGDVSDIGHWPPDVPRLSGFSWSGVSSLHGLIAWNSQGRYYRILGQRPAAAASAPAAAGGERGKRAPADPGDWAAWRALVWELYESNRVEEARQTCLDWVARFPRRAEARFAFADVEKKRLTGLGTWDRSPQEDQKSPSLAIWLLHNFPNEGPSTMQDAVRRPAAENAEQWLIAEVAFLSVADYHCAVAPNRNLVEVCDRWQQEAEQRGGSGDASYFIFRAAARLRLGQIEAARADAKAALEAERQGRAWATGAERLLAAIDAQQKDFRYECEPPVYNSRCWWPESK